MVDELRERRQLAERDEDVAHDLSFALNAGSADDRQDPVNHRHQCSRIAESSANLGRRLELRDPFGFAAGGQQSAAVEVAVAERTEHISIGGAAQVRRGQRARAGLDPEAPHVLDAQAVFVFTLVFGAALEQNLARVERGEDIVGFVLTVKRRHGLDGPVPESVECPLQGL